MCTKGNAQVVVFISQGNLKKNRISAAKTSLPHIFSIDIGFRGESRSAAGHGGSPDVSFSLFSGGMLIRVGFGIKNDG
jgi:hypothetical protein